VTQSDGQSFLQRALAFKAYEIEELADVYFFRPLGAVCAYVARALHLTPVQVTLIGTCIGAWGGWLLHDHTRAPAGLALLVFYGVLDSADGQLARMTNRASEFGRVFDGIGGYLANAAIFAGIYAGASRGGQTTAYTIVAAAAAVSTIVQAQMYDYYRRAYTDVAIKGLVPRAAAASIRQPWAESLMRGYERLQKQLLGGHLAVIRAVEARSADGVVRADDRERYRDRFYWLVRGWNVFGDNTRFYVIGALLWLGRLDWFFAVMAVPMNLVFLAVWLAQRRADRGFLRSL